MSTDTKFVRGKPVYLRLLVVCVPRAAAAVHAAVVDIPSHIALGVVSEWCLRRRPGPRGFCIGGRLAGVCVRVWCAGAVPAQGLHRQEPAAGWPAEAEACTEA